MLDDDVPTSTSQQQFALERKILPFYQELEHLENEDVAESLLLQRSIHIQYLHNGLSKLPAGFAALDASRPWIVYWILHSLALLNADLPINPSENEIIDFLASCQDKRGGYGGGPMQIPHLAPTYAAVSALITLGSEAALASIDRVALFNFLKRMCIPIEKGGGFAVHEGGEGDLRACYLCMAVAHMIGLDKQQLVQRSGMVRYIQRCQTFEGGLGGEPGNEAHGGYTFCGLAALMLANAADVLDLPRLLHWAVQRQGSMEGGFNGRTNKLVDGCYSFWQGGLFPLLQRLPPEQLGQAQALASSILQQQQEQAHAMAHPSDMDTTGATVAEGDMLHVPPLPVYLQPLYHPVMQVKSPVEQATLVLAAKSAAAQQLVSEALQASEEADAALQGSTARLSQELKQQARALLDKAADAQSAAEQANLNISIATYSAARLYPAPGPSDPALPVATTATGMPVLNPPLYNFKAMQLWILRCCQQPKGGLRDKPGKPADYYHTCYCLSGLSSSQHCSNFVLGPRENQLSRADPLCNIVEERLRAATQYFAQCPAV